MYCYGLRVGATFGDLMSRLRVKKLPPSLRKQITEYRASWGWNKLPPNTLDKLRA